MPHPDLHAPEAGAAPPIAAPVLPPAAESLTKVPVQARSRRTLERLRGAAWSLLEEGGPEQLTVTGVARRAGVSIGSFYARFEGREELLDHLSAVALEEALSFWNATLPPPATPSREAAGAAAVAESSEARVGAAGPGPDPEPPLALVLEALLDLYLGQGGEEGQGTDAPPPPGARLHALSRMDPAAQARLAHLQEAVARGIAPLLPGGGLLAAAALAAAARELALGVRDAPDGWLLSALPQPSEEGGEDAAEDAPGEGPRALLLGTLLALATPPVHPPSPGASATGPTPPHGSSASKATPTDPGPDSQEEIFDIWG